MGNKYCYSRGQRHKNLLDSILRLPFDPSRDSRDPFVSDFLDFLEMNPTALDYTAGRILKRIRERLESVGEGKEKGQLDLVLNGLQLWGLLLGWLKVSQIGEQPEGPSLLGLPGYTIKGEKRTSVAGTLGAGEWVMKPLGGKKGLTVESCVLTPRAGRRLSHSLDRFLNFQSRWFETVEVCLGPKWKVEDENSFWMVTFGLRGWTETFGAWRDLGVSSCEGPALNLLRTCLARTKHLLKSTQLQTELRMFYLLLPPFVFEKTKAEARLPIEELLAEKGLRDYGLACLAALISNFKSSELERLVAENLRYFAEKDPGMMVELARKGPSPLGIEQELFEALSEFTDSAPFEPEVMIRFFEVSSVKVLTMNNSARLAGFLCSAFADSKERSPAKQRLFQVLLDKAAQQPEIGRFGILTPLLQKLKLEPANFPVFCENLLEYLRADPPGFADEALEAPFIRLCFEALPLYPPFIACIFHIAKMRGGRHTSLAHSADIQMMLSGLKKSLVQSWTLPQESQSSLLWFFSLKTLIVILGMESGSSNLPFYADTIHFLLANCESCLAFLTSMTLAFHFEQKFIGQPEVDRILSKHDDLLAQSPFDRAFDALELDRPDSDFDLSFGLMMKDTSFGSKIPVQDVETLKKFFFSLGSIQGLPLSRVSFSGSLLPEELARLSTVIEPQTTEPSIFETKEQRDPNLISTSEIHRLNLQRNALIQGLTNRLF